jgi:hypothetical protein
VRVTKKQLEKRLERRERDFELLVQVANKERAELEQLRKDCRQGCENGDRLLAIIEGMRRRAKDAAELARALPAKSADQAACASSAVVWHRAAALVESTAQPNNMLPPAPYQERPQPTNRQQQGKQQ